ncbi:MAG: hypothetical protein L6V80_01470 [Bacteroidales bacterium]|nr:MAG: hypothetical protein L6V80_01470 [Bacteroidales bacterium]
MGSLARGDDLAHEDLGFGVAGQNLGYDGALGRDYAVDGFSSAKWLWPASSSTTSAG